MDSHRALIVAHLLGEATEEERTALGLWRSSRVANEEEFRRQQDVWDRLGDLVTRTGPTLAVAHPPTGGFGGRAGGDRGAFGLPKPARTHFIRTAAIAAVVLLALLTRIPSGNPLPSLGAEDVVTGAGEVVTLTLRDGTVVRLGPDSRLSFLDSQGPRDVLLEGKAYFAVPHLRENPFRVHTLAGDVKVLGTRFEVESRDGGVQIVVVEGEVEAGLPENRISIRRGQMGRLEPAAPPVLAAVENVYLATAWIGEFTAFESTPLTEVVTELEARFDLRIEITDEVLARRTVSGLFINQAPEEMLTSICLAVDALCSRSGDTIQMWLARASPEASLPPGPAGIPDADGKPSASIRQPQAPI